MDSTYTASAHLVATVDSTYIASANLRRTNDATFVSSAVLVAVTQCETPNTALVPTISTIDLHFDGGNSNVSSVSLLPTIVSLNIYIKSC